MSNAIRFKCPKGHTLKVSCRHAGKTIRCPVAGCGTQIVVPTRDAVELLAPSRPVPASPPDRAETPLLVIPDKNTPMDLGRMLRGDTLREWETNALGAFHVVAEVRRGLLIVGILLVVNLLALGVFMRGGQQPSVIHSLALAQCAGFFVLIPILGVTYVYPSYGWILATALPTLVLGPGCISILIAIALFSALPRASRFPYRQHLSKGRYDTIQERLKSILDSGDVLFWLPCRVKVLGRSHSVRLRLFENAALLILDRNGASVFIDRADARTCKCTQREDGHFVLEGLAPTGTLVLPEDVGREWRTWRKGVV